ncbi:LysR family transcriptional regulator [Phreatobacter stygius]|uniref:LysR family transcriptional regulator n=1 Tax=Phreatobacter stygius TaxID=1940610 RepID=A0A4D7B0Q5_9HYPH|nr:LysR substrate-binding domain-containing protein [Phreatobacter stygius]QCI66321.1 LysR family transcriptional regulator [Phreatobacter stygius]
MSHLPDLARLRYFVAVAEALSFREAAGRLNVAQPAVSRAVQQLEAEIGFKLFERTTRRVALTPAGAVLARDASEALQQLQRAVRDAGQVAAGDAGELIIGYSAQATHGPMAEIIIRFRSAYPSAQVSLYSLSSQEQLPAIDNGTIDLGFLLSAACKPPLRHVVVARQRFVMLVSRQSPLAGRASISLGELAATPFVIGTPKRWSSFRALITNVCLGAGFVPDIAEEADDVPVLLQLVSLGRGVTLYGSAIAPMLQPDIVAVPISDPHASFDISIAWHEGRQTRLAREFAAFAQAMSAA